jgi:hypothetical protein
MESRDRDPRRDGNPSAAASRQRSQILGILILAALVLLVACIRYYLKLG